MRNTLFIFALMALATLNASAQSEPRFTAAASQTEVAVGETFEVVFTLENAQNAGRFAPPDWEAAGFALLSSSQSSNFSMSNGEVSSSASYKFVLSPLSTGVMEIPSVSIKSGEEELRTTPLQIVALPSPDGSGPIVPRPGSEPKKKIKTVRM